MIDGRNVFDQPINSMNKTYENIRKIATGKLDADPRAIQQINFTDNLDRAGNTTIFFIIEEAKETILEFSQGTVKVL